MGDGRYFVANSSVYRHYILHMCFFDFKNTKYYSKYKKLSGSFSVVQQHIVQCDDSICGAVDQKQPLGAL